MTRGVADLVAVGGTLSTRARFRVRMLTGRFELPPRSLVVVTHRSDWDIPLTTNIYWPGGMWRRGVDMTFVARDDMFLPGFVAGYGALPLPLRRALARVDVGGGLRRHRLALPIASAARAHLVDVAHDDPALPLPEALGEPFLVRARALGIAAPRTLGAARQPPFLDLLWRWVEPGDADGLDGFWGRRRAQARRDLEALIARLDEGGALTLYPEGRPSPDGAIGPLQRGLSVLIRRAKPDAIVPIGLAYDPLTRGRTRAYVAVGEAFPPPAHDVEASVLRALRKTMPLTAGQVAAHTRLHGAEPELDDRPAEPRLRALLPEALAVPAPAQLLERLDREFLTARGR
jgi:1-acyl-sn-glycerol-3-phosphate acyltransferase